LSALNGLKNGHYWQKLQEFKHCRDIGLAVVKGDSALKTLVENMESLHKVMQMISSWRGEENNNLHLRSLFHDF